MMMMVVMITCAPSYSSGRGVLSFPPVFEPREPLPEVLGHLCARFPCGTGLPDHDGGATIMMMMMTTIMGTMMTTIMMMTTMITMFTLCST